MKLGPDHRLKLAHQIVGKDGIMLKNYKSGIFPSRFFFKERRKQQYRFLTKRTTCLGMQTFLK